MSFTLDPEDLRLRPIGNAVGNVRNSNALAFVEGGQVSSGDVDGAVGRALKTAGDREEGFADASVSILAQVPDTAVDKIGRPGTSTRSRAPQRRP